MEEEVEYLNEVARELEKRIRIHENEDHAGDFCPAERANTVAFIAHRLGADMDLLAEAFFSLVTLRRKEYDEAHKKKGH